MRQAQPVLLQHQHGVVRGPVIHHHDLHRSAAALRIPRRFRKGLPQPWPLVPRRDDDRPAGERLTGERLNPPAGLADRLPVLPREPPAVLPLHDLHRFSMQRAKRAVVLVVDLDASQRETVLGELGPILEVQLIVAVALERFVHASQLPEHLPPHPPEVAGERPVHVHVGG